MLQLELINGVKYFYTIWRVKMKNLVIIITLLASANIQLMAMVPDYAPEATPDAPADHQLAQVRTEYQQKWAAEQYVPNSSAAADKREATDDSYESEEEEEEKESISEELIPYSNNIVEMYLHNYPAYQRTYGSMPRDVSKLIAQKVLKTIPSVKNYLDRCLAVRIDSLPRTNHLHSWKTKYQASYPPKPEGLPEVYYHPSPIYPIISSPLLATFDKSGKYLAYIDDDYQLKIFNTSNMKCLFKSPYNLKLQNIVCLEFINNNSKIMALDKSERAFIWNFLHDNPTCQQGKITQPYLAFIQRQIAEKKALITRLNADGEDQNDPLHGFKRFFEGREILDAHYDASNKILYTLGKSRDGKRPLIEAYPNTDYHEREIIIYDFQKAKIIFHHVAIDRSFWKSSSKISDCLCVHDTTCQMFFHDSGLAKATKHIVDLRSRIIEEENEQVAALHRIEENNFMRNMTLDQAITLCILFQLKRQNLSIDLEQYPHLKLNCLNLPRKIFYQFFVARLAYKGQETKIATVVGYPAKEQGSCLTQGCTIV
jgi:hypothetical protein